MLCIEGENINDNEEIILYGLKEFLEPEDHTNSQEKMSDSGAPGIHGFQGKNRSRLTVTSKTQGWEPARGTSGKPRLPIRHLQTVSGSKIFSQQSVKS